MHQEPPSILGADRVVQTLEHWPSFHDAEIIRIHLTRDGVSTISIQVIGPDGSCKSGPMVTFTMEKIYDLRLDGEDFNVQNVIADLQIEQTARGTKVILEPCFGVAGEISAERVSVAID